MKKEKNILKIENNSKRQTTIKGNKLDLIPKTLDKICKDISCLNSEERAKNNNEVKQWIKGTIFETPTKDARH